MLFYRRKNTNQSNRDLGSTNCHIAKWLLDEIQQENEKLCAQRAEHERSLNQTGVDVYVDADFYVEKSVLNLHAHCESKHLRVHIDKQKTTVDELDQILLEYCTNPKSESDQNELMISRKESFLKLLLETHSFLLVSRVDTSSGNSGRFSYYVKSVLNNEPPKSILHQLITSKSKDCVLVVARYADRWPVGDEFAPVRVVFKFYTKSFEIREVSCTFVMSTTIKLVKQEISTIILAENLNQNSGKYHFLVNSY